MATHGTTVFLTRFQVWQRTVMHTCSVSSRTSTVATATVVLSAILARSAVIALSQRPSLSWRLTRTFGIHCLHPCRARTLSPFKFTQQSTSLLSSLVGKNIRKVILFEWVILFKNPTVIVLIGNCIRRVNVFKGSLYSWVYGIPIYLHLKVYIHAVLQLSPLICMWLHSWGDIIMSEW